MKNCHMDYFYKAFANNMSTNIKVSKAQIYIAILFGESIGSWFGNLGKKSTNKSSYSFR